MEVCMPPSDLRQFFRVKNSTFALTAGVVNQILAENVDRVGVIFSNTNAAFAFLSPDVPFAAGIGFGINQVTPQLKFNHGQDGFWSQCAWHASPSGAGITVVISELILDSSRIGR